MATHELLLGTSGLLFALFGLIVAILWILVPFAIFGIKGLLRDILRELRRANELKEWEMTADRDHYADDSPVAVEPEPNGTIDTIRAAIRESRKP